MGDIHKITIFMRIIFLLISCFLGLNMMCTAGNAFPCKDANTVISKAVENPNLIYTTYIGMPEEKLIRNMQKIANSSDWSFDLENHEYESDVYKDYTLERGSSTENSVKEILRIGVHSGYVTGISLKYRTASQKTAESLYYTATHKYTTKIGPPFRANRLTPVPGLYYMSQYWKTDQFYYAIHYQSGDINIYTGKKDNIRTIEIITYHIK